MKTKRGRRQRTHARQAVEQLNVERTIIEQAEELAGESRRKDEFLAMLAHELRSPLAPIRNALHIIRRAASRGHHSTESEAIQSASDMMERQTSQVVRLVDDLMLLVALTGWGQDTDRSRSAEAGFDVHLVKPVDHDALSKLMADLPRSMEASGR